MDAQAFAFATLDQLARALGTSVMWTLIASPVMKFYARNVALGRLALGALWAFVRVAFLAIVLYDVWTIGFDKIAELALLPMSLVMLCGVGWLISHDLKPSTVSKHRGAVGARVPVGHRGAVRTGPVFHILGQKPICPVGAAVAGMLISGAPCNAPDVLGFEWQCRDGANHLYEPDRPEGRNGNKSLLE
jgi:hypothetical protein